MVNPAPTRSPSSPSSLRAPFRFKSTRTRERSCSPSAKHSSIHSLHPPIDPWSKTEQANEAEGAANERRRRSQKRKRRRSTPAPEDHTPDVDPEVAFRESLFDAMADDEGAEFWSQIYGTPVETFDRTFLEHMSEEEYASYVRTQMWQRTPEYLLMEKQRMERDRAAAQSREEEELRAARRRKRKADQRQREREKIKSDWGKYREDWDNEVDAVMSKRASKKVDWEGGWERYLGQWGDLIVDGANDLSSSSTPQPLQLLLPYPVLSGLRQDITSDAVSEFLQNCPPSLLLDAPRRSSAKIPDIRDSSSSLFPSTSRNLQKMRDVEAVLKAERLRWHPDKIQQRFGPKYSEGVDAESMKVVTEVFRIVDALLGRIRVKLGDVGKTERGQKDHVVGEPYRYW